MATSSSVILLIVAGLFLGAAYGGDKLHVPPAQDISSFTFQLRSIYGNTSMSNKTFDNNDMNGDDGGPRLRQQLPNRRPPRTEQQLPPADGNLNIYALPVGQGDCTVIQCPRPDGDGHSIITIIDAGSSRSTGFDEVELVHFLRLREVTIRYIFLTHPHRDHIKYIDDIRNAYRRPVHIYHSCTWEHYNPWVTLRNVDRRTRVLHCCGRNCSPPITLCGGGNQGNVILRVIGSEYTNTNCANNINGDSIVSTIEYRGVKTLITGDFEGSEAFINRYLDCVGRGPRSYLRADIFRLSHHGAYNERANNNSGVKTANRREFLEAINARNVFSSSGLHQGYKHPRCIVHDYYRYSARTRVVPHLYTCYKRRNNQLVPKTTTIRTARYVTTVRQGQNIINYIIKFSIAGNERIARNRRISSSAIPT